MRTRNEKAYQQRKIEIMEQCFDCYAEHGLTGTGLTVLADACGVSRASIYTYFDSLDDMIAEATEYCMSKVEQEFMAIAPKNSEDLFRFIDEVPYWTAQQHGKKYRLMYQVYTLPKFIDRGKQFFAGVNERYHAYARQLEPVLGIPCDTIVALIFILVRASVHYAMFEDEYYLKSEINVLKQMLYAYMGQ